MLAAAALLAPAARGAEAVCELFADLRAAEGRQVVVRGELVLSDKVAVIGASICEHRFTTRSGGAVSIWPTGLKLRPAAGLKRQDAERFEEAVRESVRVRKDGKRVEATATLAGRVNLEEAGDYPGIFAFESVESIEVRALPDGRELPVIPICDLFQNLEAWRGRRIAVRGESARTMEGSWIAGRCRGAFITEGHRWPVLLTIGGVDYLAEETSPLVEARDDGPVRGEQALRGRLNVIRTATYVGLLRMKSEYHAVCSNGQSYGTGFGHMGGAAAELVLDTILDRVVEPRGEEEPAEPEAGACAGLLTAQQCETATLARAAGLGCAGRVRTLFEKDGLDSRDGNESEALGEAIRMGKEDVVKLLLTAGAPLSPTKFRLWPPVHEAAHARRVEILRLLLRAGASPDALDKYGQTYLATFGHFDPAVLRALLEAGANVNARDNDGETALMHAASHGYEQAAKVLLEHHADIHMTDNKGRTALMHAAMGEYVDVIPLLLERGADLRARDRDGRTALELARDAKDEVAAELLTAAGR